MWYLYHVYGASLRNLVLRAGNRDMYRERVTAEIGKLSPRGLTTLLLYANNATDSSHYLMSTGPSPADRTKPERKIASPHILEECCKKVFGNRVELLREFYYALHSEPATSAAAGMVFEYRFLHGGRGSQPLPHSRQLVHRPKFHLQQLHEE
jgi:hypothetical protein